MSLYGYGYYNPAAGPGWCFSSEYEKYDYQHGGYLTYSGGKFGSATGITDVSLAIYPPELCTPHVGTLPSNFNYNEEFTISNFTMLLTGYFRPEMSGNYTFTLKADDLAYLSFGAGNAFDCCGETESVSDPGGFDLIVVWRAADDMSGTVTYDLQAGVYYPLRLLYANRDYYGVLSLTFQDPNGVVHNDFTDHIYQFPDEALGCANEIQTTTNVWTGTYTTTYSTSVFTSVGTDGFGTVETIYYVHTPEPVTSSTSYQGGTVSQTTTVSTYVTHSVGQDDRTTIETVYVVETPEPQTSSTIFTGASVSASTTASTYTTKFVGTDGITTTETVYVVETPEPQTSSTTFTGGSASMTTTASTYTTKFVGTDGITTTETVYIVETPEPQTSSTTFTSGSASMTTTASTYTTKFVGTDGITTTETVYIVETPRPISSSFSSEVSSILLPSILESSKSTSTDLSSSQMLSSVSTTSRMTETSSINIPTSQKDVDLSLTVKTGTSNGLSSHSLDAESRYPQSSRSAHSSIITSSSSPSSTDPSSYPSTVSPSVLDSETVSSSLEPIQSSSYLSSIVWTSRYSTIAPGSSISAIFSNTSSVTTAQQTSTYTGERSSVLSSFVDPPTTSTPGDIPPGVSFSDHGKDNEPTASIIPPPTTSTAGDIPPGVSFSNQGEDNDPTASIITQSKSLTNMDSISSADPVETISSSTSIEVTVISSYTVSTQSSSSIYDNIPPAPSHSGQDTNNEPTDSSVSLPKSSSSLDAQFTSRDGSPVTSSTSIPSGTVVYSSFASSSVNPPTDISISDPQKGADPTASVNFPSTFPSATSGATSTNSLTDGTGTSHPSESIHTSLEVISSSHIKTDLSTKETAVIHSASSPSQDTSLQSASTIQGDTTTLVSTEHHSTLTSHQKTSSANNTVETPFSKMSSHDESKIPNTFTSSAEHTTSIGTYTTVISGTTTLITTTEYITVGCSRTAAMHQTEATSNIPVDSGSVTSKEIRSKTIVASATQSNNQDIASQHTTTSTLSASTISSDVSNGLHNNDNVNPKSRSSLSPKDSTFTKLHKSDQITTAVTSTRTSGSSTRGNSPSQSNLSGTTNLANVQTSSTSSTHSIPTSPIMVNSGSTIKSTLSVSFISLTLFFIFTV